MTTQPKTPPIEGTPRVLRDPYMNWGTRWLLAYSSADGILRAKCLLGCQKLYDIPVTPEQFAEFTSGPSSRHIQQVMPNLSPDDRELLISGMCGTCFDATFADEPDEDERAAVAEVAPVPGSEKIDGSLLDGEPVLATRLSDGGLRETPLAGDAVTAFLASLSESMRTNVEGAKRAVVTRMSGCAEPNCLACRTNREMVDQLIVAVRDASQTPGVITYKGARVNGEADVMVVAPHKALHRLAPRNDVRNHSPDGFEWGYGGSGPAQTALALCIHALGGNVARAEKVYQQFKFRVIGRLDGDEWEMTQQQVIEHIEAIEQENRHGRA